MNTARKPPMPAPTFPPLPEIVIPHPHVEIHATLGVPVVSGTKVQVLRLFRLHRTGTTFEMLLRRYAALGPARVFDAVAFAYDNLDLMSACVLRDDASLYGK